MKIQECHCVDCPTEIGCYGTSCPLYCVDVYYCDDCKSYAEYTVEGRDLCEECARDLMLDYFQDMSVEEMMSTLGVEWDKVGEV